MSTVVHSLKARTFNQRMGLWLFILSDSIVFLAILAARYYTLGTSTPAEVNQFLGLLLTCILLASSFFANRADVLMAHGDSAGYRLNTLVTIVLGVVFMALVVGLEWPEAMHFAPPSSQFGTYLFSLTGLHTTHILSGLIVLLVAYFKAGRGGYTTEDHWGAEAAAIYWHFVDVVWVFVYFTLYLMK